MSTKIYSIHLYSHFAAVDMPFQYFVSAHRTGNKTKHYGPISNCTMNRILCHCINWQHTVLSDMSNDKKCIAITIILEDYL